MSKKRKRTGTIIHGIAASEHLDSAGERIEIKGIDISSLTVDGVLNFEHKSEQVSQIVGKILTAKKIFEKSDCENDQQRYFWDKIKTPFLYITAELFDAVGHQGAKDVAAMLKYDEENKDGRDRVKKLINYSIEGQKLEKRGSTIKKCIARKVSITITPCNKVCEAEELKPMEKAAKEGQFVSVQDLQNFNKSEKTSSCQIMKAAGFTPKRVFSSSNAPQNMKAGDRIINDRPRAKTGAEIYGKPPKFSADGRKISDGTAPKADAPKAPKPPAEPKVKMDTKTPDTPKDRVTDMDAYRASRGEASTARPYGIIKNAKRAAIVDNLKKSLTAGSMVGAPGQMSGEAALVKEDLGQELQVVCEPKADIKKEKKKKKKKVEPIEPVEPISKNEAEELLKFVQQKHPDMGKEEQVALAKTVALLRKSKKKPFKGYNEKKHAKTGGLNDKARKKYNRENNANLKRPVTSDNPKGEAKGRKKSFCARMSGVKGPTSKEGELTPKGAALKRWKC